jgi:nitroimidazol reductase NimA-like FMN-containing flavoprotein (pyridoxamine 5'-phosphate oxidase superfamily)
VTRTLDQREVEELLRLDVPAHLATLDPNGFPRITPIWFVWADGAFHMTSVEGQPHLGNIARDPRASICVDIEESEPVEGVRRNRRVKGHGHAELFTDQDGEWTRRITVKYIRGAQGEAAVARRVAMPRVGIRLRLVRLTARGT